MARGEPQKLSFTVPIFEPHPPQYYIRAVSDSWLQAEAFYTITFHNLALPEVVLTTRLLFPFIIVQYMLDFLWWQSLHWPCRQYQNIIAFRLIRLILNFWTWSLFLWLHLEMECMKPCTSFHTSILFKLRFCAVLYYNIFMLSTNCFSKFGLSI